MIFSAEALRQIGDLQAFYEELERADAIRQLRLAIQSAVDLIETRPETGLAAPRPYPETAAPGRAWFKVGRYWFRYTLEHPPAVVSVFFETANIPGRL